MLMTDALRALQPAHGDLPADGRWAPSSRPRPPCQPFARVATQRPHLRCTLPFAIDLRVSPGAGCQRIRDRVIQKRGAEAQERLAATAPEAR